MEPGGVRSTDVTVTPDKYQPLTDCHIDFTERCTGLIDTDGQVHSLYEDERCEHSDPKDYLYGMDFPPEGNDWQTVTGGDYHACVMDSEGRLECCGVAADLQPGVDVRFIELDSGGWTHCGVTTMGTIDC